MFDRFTDRSRDALAMARHEAQAPSGASLNTEYILLGLLGRECGAVHIIEELGVDVGVLREDILGQIEMEPQASSSEARPFKDDALRILELAMEEAGRGHDRYIGTEHLLAALLRGGDNAAATILRSHGVALDRVRAERSKLDGPDGRVLRDR
jgi:ATP-dependent Clp protease ATP-binding subunit ClpC